MRKIATLIFLFSAINMYAQNVISDSESQINNLKDDVKALKKENKKLNDKLEILNSTTLSITDSLNNLKLQVESNSESIMQTNRELGTKIQETGKNNDRQISAVDQSLSKKALYGIIAFLVAALLSGVTYFLLGSRIKNGRTSFVEQLSKTNKALDEEKVNVNTKLAELYSGQMEILKDERNRNPSNNAPDHSLALKVADEIMRINKNLSNMDSNTKGLKQLAASVQRIEDNFATNGYEMPDLLSKPYDPRMKMIVVNAIPNEEMNKGEEIISKLIKPQVNFKGVMIQAAQIEISVGQK